MILRIVSSCYVIVYVMASLQIGFAMAQIESGKYRMDFSEEQEPGTVVANLAQLFNVRSDDLPGRWFEILGQRMKAGNEVIATDGSWLNINRVTGVITVKEPVDRETECGEDSELECMIILQAAMMPQPHFRLQDFELVVTDVNDHAPNFPATGSDRIFSLNVSENVAETTKISLDKFLATDEDIDENALIYYSISRNDHFGLNQFEDDTGASHLELVILSKLDYEQKTNFDLTLTAKDRGSPTPRSSQVFLRINVVDANDNTPTFEESVYNLELRENLPPGHTITTVVARDADTGRFGQVRYFVPTDGNSVTARKLITVDPKTGAVKLLKPLDREIKNNLRVVIAAKDMGEGRTNTGKTVLMIRIMDVNDNAPRIHVNVILKGPDKAAYVSENAALGTFIAHVSAHDADNADSGRVSISIATEIVKSTQTPSRQRDSRSNGVLVHDSFILKSGNLISTNAKLDREVHDRYTIKITACDHGNPRRCSQKNVSVIVLDSNDHHPQFRTNQHLFTLSESAQIGNYITSVQAYDKDSMNTPAITKNKEGKIVNSQNGEVRYSLIGGGAVFAIESKTGKLTLVGNLDYEMKKFWKLLAVARDLGVPSQSTNFSINVKVVDVNDHKPEFTNPGVANMTVYATILEDRTIIRIKTIDRDAGSNAEVWYSIASEDGAKKSQKFLIDPVTGSLRFNASNKLTKLLGDHTLTIKATDKGTPPLESETRLFIKVTDLPLSEIIPNYQDEDDTESSKITVIVLASLASATVILLLILACIVIKCRKENKEIRTYNCRDAESKSGRNLAYPSKSNVSQIGSVDEVVVVATPGVTTVKDINFGRAMEINRSKPSTLRSAKSIATSLQTPKFAAVNKGPTFTTFSQKSHSNIVSNHQLASPHPDGDSGRGDSDKDSDSYGVEKEAQGSLARSESNYSQHCGGYLNELGPRCTISCRKYGHSDDCWMPVVAHCEIHGEHDSFVYNDTGSDFNDTMQSNRNYPENVTASTSSLPVGYGTIDNCGLETISETQPLRVVLDVGDQSSTYSYESYSHQDYPTYPTRIPHCNSRYRSDVQVTRSPPPYYTSQMSHNQPLLKDQPDWREAFRPQQNGNVSGYRVTSPVQTERPASARGILSQSTVPNTIEQSQNDSVASASSNAYVPIEMLESLGTGSIRPQPACDVATSSTPEILATGSVMDKVKRFSQTPMRRNSLRDHVLQSRFLSRSSIKEPFDTKTDDFYSENDVNHNENWNDESDASLVKTKNVISEIDHLITSQQS